MNSFELNKIAGAGLGTLLFVMWLNIISGAIFSHGRLVKAGYRLPAGQETAAGASGAPTPSAAPIGQRLSAADVKKGEADTKPCQSCHNFEEGAGAKIGPPLYGVVDRTKGSVEGFAYSDSIKAKGGKWTYADLDQFLADPKSYAPGTKMTYAGEADPKKRADIIDYLHTLSNNPEPLPASAQTGSAPSASAGATPARPTEPAPADHPGPLPADGSAASARSASTEAPLPGLKEHPVKVKAAHQPKLVSHTRK
ncbi:MAG TPA: cytochrome c family protein [Methylocella sp.]|nr:cytochrome c family protein [Methylocella sp.]